MWDRSTFIRITDSGVFLRVYDLKTKQNVGSERKGTISAFANSCPEEHFKMYNIYSLILILIGKFWFSAVSHSVEQ